MFSRATATTTARRSQTAGRMRHLGYSLLALAVGACGGLTDLEKATDGCGNAPTISMGQSISGRLSSEDCVEYDGAYVDYVGLSLSSQSSVRIDLTTPAFDAAVELRDDFGNQWGYGDAFGPTNARIVRDLPPGSYTIVVRSINPGAVGSYELAVSQGPDCSSLGALSMGDVVTGSLEASDCLFEWGGTVDNWSLSLSGPGKVRIDLESSAFDEIVLVRDQQGNVMWVADWTGPSGHAQLEAELPAGSWTVSVTSPYETARGAYELSVDVAPPCTPGADVVLGETVPGQISSSDCYLDSWMPADSFGLSVAAETPVSIHLKSTDFEPLVILRDQNGWDVAMGYDMMADGNARIRTSLEPGKYALYVTGYPSGGDYSLTVEEIECDAPLPIEFGQTVNGALDENDCMRAGGAFQESWTLVLANDTTVRIDLVSNQFDTWLVLKDSAGAVIVIDDDGGSGVNSRVQRGLAAGTYEIVASSYGPGALGGYQLTVDAPPPPMAGAADIEGTQQARGKAAPPDGGAAELLELVRRRWGEGEVRWWSRRQ